MVCRMSRLRHLYTGRALSGMGSLSLSLSLSLSMLLSLSMSLSLSEEEDLHFCDHRTSKREEKTRGGKNLLSNALHGFLYTKVKVSHTARLSKSQHAL